MRREKNDYFISDERYFLHYRMGVFFSRVFLCTARWNLSNKLEKFTWNVRVDAHQKKPLSYIYKLEEESRYVLLALLIMGINFGMVTFQYIIGIILLSPIFLIIQGFLMGVIVGQGDTKTKGYSFLILIFEIGAFSTAAEISFYIGLSWIFLKIELSDILFTVVRNKYFYLPLILLMLNGITESYSIAKGIEGVPGKRAVKEKIYK